MDITQLTKSSTLTLHTGRKIPLIGYGTYQLQGQDCVQGTKVALSCGYTHIDTASYYANEAEIKTAIKALGINRDNIYITSKIQPSQQGAEKSRIAVQAIINKLDCQYLDLVLIHWPGVSQYKSNDIENSNIRLETWNTFISLQKEGKVRDIGVSNFLKHHLQHLIKNSSVIPTVNQFEIHPLLWQGPTIEMCHKYHIAIQAYSPLARQSEKLFKNAVMMGIAEKYNKTVAQVSLRWCLQNGFIILPKSKTESRIKENIDIYDFELSEQDMKNINKLRVENVRVCWDPNTIKY